MAGGFHALAPYGSRGLFRAQEPEQGSCFSLVGSCAAYGCRKSGGDLNVRGETSQQRNTFEVNQFAQLLKAQLHIATGHQTANGYTGGAVTRRALICSAMPHVSNSLARDTPLGPVE